MYYAIRVDAGGLNVGPAPIKNQIHHLLVVVALMYVYVYAFICGRGYEGGALANALRSTMNIGRL